MAGRAKLVLYGGREEETRPNSSIKVLPIELQPFRRNTEFDLGSIVELHYRSEHSSLRNPGNDYSVGYIVESREWGGKYDLESIKLSKELPEKRFFNATMSLPKIRISEFRLLAVPDPEAGDSPFIEFIGSRSPEKCPLGAIIEILEERAGRHGPSKDKRKAGYITRLGSNSIGLSMDHPSNRRGSFSVRNMTKIPYSEIHNYRVLGQRDLA